MDSQKQELTRTKRDLELSQQTLQQIQIKRVIKRKKFRKTEQRSDKVLAELDEKNPIIDELQQLIKTLQEDQQSPGEMISRKNMSRYANSIN